MSNPDQKRRVVVDLYPVDHDAFEWLQNLERLPGSEIIRRALRTYAGMMGHPDFCGPPMTPEQWKDRRNPGSAHLEGQLK